MATIAVLQVSRESVLETEKDANGSVSHIHKHSGKINYNVFVK